MNSYKMQKKEKKKRGKNPDSAKYHSTHPEDREIILFITLPAGWIICFCVI